LRISDRKEAIKAAVGMAKKGDIILLAGKGHEDYQEIKGVKYPFDDKKIIVEMFELMKS
jgi:UDP-N-acetylmuramoyl-L-alanyl-D-glutamate--2,6-diaminopimelate ligase